MNAGVSSQSTIRVECESILFNDEICKLPHGVVSVKQTKRFSSASCIEGIDWTVDKDKEQIIVRNGCRGRFSVQ